MLLILSLPCSIYPHKHGRVIHGNLRHIRYMSLKMTRDCGNLSVAVLLFHYKYSLETQTQLRKICKRSRTTFGNLHVYKPSALRKKPSAYWKKPYDSRKKPSGLQKKPSGLRKKPSGCGGDAPQTHFGKAFRIAASILKMHTILHSAISRLL